MIKKLTTAERIRRYMETHPKAKPKDIAHDLGVSVKYIHVLRSTDKKKKALGLPIRRIKRNYSKRLTLINPKTGNTIVAVPVQMPETPPVPGTEMLIDLAQDKDGNITENITMLEPQSDPVNHPSHYKVGGIETIDFIEAKKLNYNLGNVVKYITRADHKGNRQQDLAKAMWYLKREMGQL